MTSPFDYLFEAALGIGIAVLGWLHLHRRSEVKDMREAIEKAEARAEAAEKAADEAKNHAVALAFEAGQRLAEHKLYASETFARRVEVEKMFDKAEQRGREQIERLDEIRDLALQAVRGRTSH